MKTMVELIVYGVISGLFGLVICGLSIHWNRKRAALIAGVIFFGGPIAAYLYVALREDLAASNFEADVAYVKELCAKQGGDKIYRTVDNVEGVFQMKARNPDPEGQWRDQYGMVDPWGMAMGDSEELLGFLSTTGRGYWYFEQQPRFGAPDGPPYRRKHLVSTPELAHAPSPDAVISREGNVLIRQPSEVKTLRSKYGYYIEDLSTKEMRRRWIAGGRIKIVDLNTREVIAERTGYFRAVGRDAKYYWSGASAFQNQRICPHDSSLHGFLFAVLKPVQQVPNALQLNSLQEQ